jgi:hypothetical protein
MSTSPRRLLKLRGDAPGRSGSGQIIVLFAASLTVIVLGVGLVIDGGNALAQRRGSQNASDFAALGGARVVAEWVSGDTNNGTDGNVVGAIDQAISANGGRALTYGAPNSPRYVDSNGNLLGYVGTGTIPTGTAGVQVSSDRQWRPFFASFFGATNWTATTVATAKGGYAAAGPTPGTLFPVGIALAFFQTYPFCDGAISTDPSSSCSPKHLTPGNLNVPGGFGWLAFGCPGFGLGQGSAGGCDTSKPDLQDEIGPPSESHGCCTVVGQSGSPDKIGSLPGNKVSADCSYYIDNQITVTVPIWDYAGGTGSNAWYHIVGFAGFQITGCSGGKDIEGVWRKAFFTGPTTTTPSGVTGATALGVQLVQ